MKKFEDLSLEELEYRYGTTTPNRFDKLRHSYIVGIIDQDGMILSKQIDFTDDDVERTHESLFPLIKTGKRWTWSFDKSVEYWLYKENFEDGDFDKIIRHLRRTYGIRFWSNGYHDLDYFISKMSKSRNE